MPTSFETVYELNNIISQDIRLQNQKINLVYQLKYGYLKYSISYFQYDCNKNITDMTPFSQIEYQFVGDGINKNFTLDSVPPIQNKFYVTINNIEIPQGEYNYNTTTNQVEFVNIPDKNDEIYIASYYIGQFNSAELDNRELNILSEGMVVPYLKERRNYSELLSQMIYSGDFKIYSQSQHISALNQSIDSQYYNYVLGLINDYSYKSQDNLNGLGNGDNIYDYK